MQTHKHTLEVSFSLSLSITASPESLVCALSRVTLPSICVGELNQKKTPGAGDAESAADAADDDDEDDDGEGDAVLRRSGCCGG